MASPAAHFTRLQKVAVFLIVIGEEKARSILADLDLETIERINRVILALGDVAAEQKAAVMVEFADFFFKDKPLPAQLASPTSPPPPKPSGQVAADQRPAEAAPLPPREAVDTSADEDAATHTLDNLRRSFDSGKINWGNAGYDFGEGFKGNPGEPRS